LHAGIYRNTQVFDEMYNLFSDEVKKNAKETSIFHYIEKYSEPELPPFWSTIELLSFGQTVKLFNALSTENRNLVARTFKLDEKFLSSWMHGLTIVRNHCAHHSRLWNRDLTVKPRINQKQFKSYFVDSKRLYNQFIIIQILLNEVNPDSSWQERLFNLITEYKILPKNMGFPVDGEIKLRQIKVFR
jgi:abortive infection bacteriophage resistance protein